jgi:hypothetical protein
LGAASSVTGSQALRGSRMSRPLAENQASSSSEPPVIVAARKYSGDSSRSENFMIGQFRPQASVRPMSPARAAPRSKVMNSEAGARPPPAP